MNPYLLLGKQTYIRNEHKCVAIGREKHSYPTWKLRGKKSQQWFWIQFPKLFLKHGHHHLYYSCYSAKPITTSLGGQEGGG